MTIPAQFYDHALMWPSSFANAYYRQVVRIAFGKTASCSSIGDLKCDPPSQSPARWSSPSPCLSLSVFCWQPPVQHTRCSVLGATSIAFLKVESPSTQGK